jgi:hypothetical protein
MCRKPFDLPVVPEDNSALIVEGDIMVGANKTTRIQLSRLRSTADPEQNLPENNANVRIIGSNGTQWPLYENGKATGTYEADYSLDPGLSYKVRILTSSGKTFESKMEAVVPTPEVDSVTWKYQDDAVKVYVHTHDPAGKSRFYRWDYAETWEHRAWYETYFDFLNGQIITRPVGDQIYSCWRNEESNSILIGNSNDLTDDVISYQPVTAVYRPSQKMYVRYSILVKQWGLSREAYNFWSILKKNTELTGTLFDPQPSQLPSNLTCTSDPLQVVVGYVSACKVTEKRMFILNSALPAWPYRNETLGCTPTEGPKFAMEAFLATHPDFLPAYYITAGGGYGVAPRVCVDCRLQGGDIIKPSFW